MIRSTILIWTACLGSALPAAAADDSEKAAILALLERAFEAVASGDPADWQPLLTDQAHSLSIRPAAQGPTGTLEVRERSYKDTLKALKPGGPAYYERWLGTPEVRVHGPIATIWGDYDFWIDGRFSHCGVDTAQLAKVDGMWKIAHLMWTVERKDCPSADGPAPAGSQDQEER